MPGRAAAPGQGDGDAADHVTVLTDALEQLPEQTRRRVLVRADRGAGSNKFLTHSIR